MSILKHHLIQELGANTRASPRSLSPRIAGCAPCVGKQAFLQGWLCLWVCVPCKCACFDVGYFFLPLLSCLFFFDSGK